MPQSDETFTLRHSFFVLETYDFLNRKNALRGCDPWERNIPITYTEKTIVYAENHRIYRKTITHAEKI